MSARLLLCLVVLAFLAVTSVRAQPASPPPDAIRVTVSMNADGTRTTYQYDSPNHRATATTTTPEGKVVGKILYVLDEAGRFASGEVYGPNDRFRFKTLYKYDEAGKLVQETQMGEDDVVHNKIVYAYDKNGKPTGYSIYDGAGKLIRQTPGVAPVHSPTPPKRR
jgi:YD repeat-containing protein